MLLQWLRNWHQRFTGRTQRAAHFTPRLHRWCQVRLELLEDRITPNTVNWIGGIGGDGKWQNPLNWQDAVTLKNHVPGAGDDAVINVPGVSVTHASGTDTVQRLTMSDPFTLSGGSLTVGSTAASGTVSDSSSFVIMNGATLSAATIATGTTLSAASNGGGGYLDEVTINGTLDVANDISGVSAAAVSVTDGMTLNGTILVGSADGAVYGDVYFRGGNIFGTNFPPNQTLSGSGSILFGASQNNSLGVPDNNATLTIAAGLTVHGQSGTIGSQDAGSFVNQATIAADLAGRPNGANNGGSFTLTGTSWTNQGSLKTGTGETMNFARAWSNTGSIAMTGGVLNFGGTFTTSDMGIFAPVPSGNFSRSGSTAVNLAGTLNNNESTLALDGHTGSWNLVAPGIINGGTITTTGGNNLVCSSSGGGGYLNGVTLIGTLDVANNLSGVSYAAVNVTNGMTVNGTILVGSADGSIYGGIYFRGGNINGINFSLTPTLSGSGSILFGASAANNLGVADNSETLTIASGLTLDGQSGTIGSQDAGSFINQATIAADLAGRPNGAGNGGSFTLTGSSWSNQGAIQVAAGETVNFARAWSNSGSIAMTGGTLNFGGTFSTKNIGVFTPAPSANFSRTGNTVVNLTGTADNTGSTLALDAHTGAWNLVAPGTIKGGTITTASGNNLVAAGNGGGGYLDGVTLNGTLDVANNIDGVFNANVNITDNMTLNGTILVGSSDGSIYGNIYFRGGNIAGTSYPLNQTLSGSGSIQFGASQFNTLNVPDANSTLSIVPKVTVHGQNGTLFNTFVNQGTIDSDGGGTIALNGTNWTNSGIVEAQNGSTVLVTGSNTNISSNTLTGGSWEVFANSTLRLPSTITTNAATILLDGAGSNIYSGSTGTSDALAGTFVNNAAGGSFTIQNGRSFMAPAAFTNSGNLTVGANSAFSVLGAAPPPKPGLVSWWKAEGNTNDSLGNNGASATNALSYVPGASGQGFTFGSNGYLEIPDAANLDNQQATLSAWVRSDGPGPNNDNGGSVIIDKDINRSSGIQSSLALGWRATDNHFFFGVDGTFVLSNDAFPKGTFHEVAGTYDGKTIKLYVDGVLEAQQSFTATIEYDSTVPWTIGSNPAIFRATGFPRTWNGVIDEPAVHNRALSQAEIQLMASGGGCTQTGGTTTLSGGSLTAGPVTQNAGTFIDNGNLTATSGLTVSTTDPIQATILQGAGTVTGNVTNSGTVSPGNSPGILTINGNYTQSSTGILDMEIAGTNAGNPDFDQLNISGAAVLDGTLVVSFLAGFQPTGGDSFPIMSFGAVSGDFANETGLSISGGPTLTPIYSPSVNATTLSLVATPAAQPDAFTSSENTTLTLTFSDLTGNDVGAGLQPELISRTTSAGGSMEPNFDAGTFRYTPPTDFAGTDSFSYQDRDINSALSNVVTDTITVNPVAPPQAELEVTIGPVKPATAVAGQPYTYTVTVTNAGPQQATNVVLLETTDPAAQLYSVITSLGTITEISPTQDSIAFGTLAVNAGVTAVISVTAANPGTYTDTASATADQANPKPADAIATVTETVVAPQAELEVSIGPVKPGTGLTGQPYSYTVTVTNAGPQQATNVVLLETTDARAQLYSVTTSGTITEISPTQDSIAFGTLAVNASVAAVISVAAANPGTYTDTASATADQANPKPADATASVTETVVAPQAELEVSIGPVKPGTGLTGQPYSYTVTVTNAGPQQATNVVLLETTDPKAQLYSVITSGTITEISPTQDSIAFGTLAVNASVTAVISVTAANPDTYTDTASATADQTNPKPADATATVTETVVAPQAELEVSIGPVTPTPALTGLPYTYTVRVSNAGPQPATNVVLLETTDPNVRLYSVTPVPGIVTEISPTQDSIAFGTLDVNASVTVTVNVIAANAGTYTDTASATANETNPKPAEATNTVTTTVTAPLPPPPLLKTDSFVVGFNTTLTVKTPGVLYNDIGTGLTVAVGTTTTHGSLTLNPDGSLAYTPSQNYVGNDSFTYRAVDSANQTSDFIKDTIVVLPAPPVANPDTYTMPANGALIINAPGVLDNDTGTSLVVELVSGPANGSLSLNSDGSFTYVPVIGFTSGTDTFVYRVRDTSGQVNSATVSITVQSATMTFLAAPASWVFGQNVVFTAVIKPASFSGPSTPTGQVVFTVDGTPQVPVNLVGAVASFVATNLTAGAHTVQASYRGDTNFFGSSSIALTQRLATTTQVRSTTARAGQPLILTATVSASSARVPIGTVTFLDGKKKLGTARLSVSGQAKLVLRIPLAAGGHAITVAYEGNGTFAGSSSKVLRLALTSLRLAR